MVVFVGIDVLCVYVCGKYYYVDLLFVYGKLNYGSLGEWMLVCIMICILFECGGDDVFFLFGGKMVDILGYIDLCWVFIWVDCLN